MSEDDRGPSLTELLGSAVSSNGSAGYGRVAERLEELRAKDTPGRLSEAGEEETQRSLLRLATSGGLPSSGYEGAPQGISRTAIRARDPGGPAEAARGGIARISEKAMRVSDRVGSTPAASGTISDVAAALEGHPPSEVELARGDAAAAAQDDRTGDYYQARTLAREVIAMIWRDLAGRSGRSVDMARSVLEERLAEQDWDKNDCEVALLLAYGVVRLGGDHRAELEAKVRRVIAGKRSLRVLNAMLRQESESP